MLSDEQILEFKTTGCLVIPNVLTEIEVQIARQNFHVQLKSLGIDHDKILRREVVHQEGPRIKSKVARIFYAKWKLLDVMMHPLVCRAFDEIMEATYRTNEVVNFTHPFGKSTNNHVFIDRVCWRLPDSIRAEGGLGLHLDRNPFDPYSYVSHFRPIQGFLALTDHFTSTAGGLKVVKGFHMEINEYFQTKKEQKSDVCGGAFYRMNGTVHAKLAKRCEPVFVPNGSLVLWDNRIPHATCDKLDSSDTREVVYCSFLPNVKFNQDYIHKQLLCLRNNCPPPAYHDRNHSEKVDRNWNETELTPLQKDMLGIT
jgi:hypothetical protein